MEGYRYIEEVERWIEECCRGLSSDTIENAYRPRIKRFFETYVSRQAGGNKPVYSIQANDVQQFLAIMGFVRNSANYHNYYHALNKFFTYTFDQSITGNVMYGVIPPEKPDEGKNYIPVEHVEKMTVYTEDDTESILERFLLSFFLFTGLKRDTIFQINHNQLELQVDNQLFLNVENKKLGNSRIPLSSRVFDLYNAFCEKYDVERKSNKKVFDYNKNYLSTKLSEISLRVTGVSYYPQYFVDTFIRRCLDRGMDVGVISRLTVKKTTSILKHIEERTEMTLDEKGILNSLY